MKRTGASIVQPRQKFYQYRDIEKGELYLGCTKLLFAQRLTKTEENQLPVRERRLLIKIWDGKKEWQISLQKNNEEIHELMELTGAHRCNQSAKKTLDRQLGGTRWRETPVKRWRFEVEGNVRMVDSRWKEKVNNRKNHRPIIGL